MTLILHSSSSRETKAWGRRLASMLQGGELIGFSGELGVGKTCFIKGLARGLNLREEDILSPTFTMIQEHRGRLQLYHIDLYRLEAAGLDDLRGCANICFHPASRRWNGSIDCARPKASSCLSDQNELRWRQPSHYRAQRP